MMLALLKLFATMAVGASIMVSCFDAVLHAILLVRTRRVKKHLGLLLARAGFAEFAAIVLWYVVIPAPTGAWSTPQAWGFVLGMIVMSTGLLLASGSTYEEFASKKEEG